jgi:membrane protein DedA with SNARE-associated domain
MRRRSTLWFLLAAGWSALFAVNILRHHDKNTVVMGIAVAAFLVIGAINLWRESKTAKKR